MTRYARQYRSIARALSRMELARSSMDDAFGIDELGLLDKNAGRRWLDFYGDEGLRLALDRYGIEREVRHRGYLGMELETRAHDDRHTLLISGRTAADPEGPAHRLVELVVRRDRLIPHEVPGLPALDTAYDALTVDWLLLQDPQARFTPERPRLPGQEWPGLGIGERVLELLYLIVQRLELGALVTVAEHLHNAILYARELPFFDPAHGGRLRALEDLLLGREGLSIAQASWAMEWGCVRGADDAVLKWKGEAQLRAFAPTLQEWIRGTAHQEAVQRAAATTKLTLDRAYFDERWREEAPALEGRAPTG